MPQVKILWDDSVGAFRVSTPYKPEFVELLKQIIPIADRMWDPQTKIWTLAEKYGPPVKGLCERLWGATNVQYMDQATMAAAQAAAQTAYAKANAQNQQQYFPPPPVAAKGIDLTLLLFVKLLPYAAAKKAYLIAAMELHPDKNNGNGEKMTALNTAWSKLETEFYGK